MASGLRRFMCPRRNTQPTSPTRSDDDYDQIQTPSIPQIFADATLYRQIINHPEQSSLDQVSDTQTIHDFAELVGHDLTAPDRSLAGRFAQLSAEDVTWHLDDAPLTDEPESTSSSDESFEGSDRTPRSSTNTHPTTASEHSHGEDGDSKLSPDEIVDLLQHEFGELGPPGEEKLLLEVDAALVQDVIILGVIHITTHRFAFHASLPTTHSDLFAPNSVIKAGPAVIHRKGLHRKRRVWLELSNDFISTFSSSLESDRIRPLKSVLLSSVRRVLPEDPHNPCVVRVAIDEKPGTYNSLKEGHLEFDTVESAREWRRELQGTIFFYRRSLISTIKTSSSEETDGIRIIIPLQCISRHIHKHYADTFHFHSLIVTCNQGASTPASENPPSDSENIDFPVVQFATTSFEQPLVDLSKIIEQAKIRTAHDDLATSLGRKIVVDYGSLGLEEAQKTSNGKAVPQTQDQIVCDLLGIPYSDDVWVRHTRLHLGMICSGYLVVSPQWIGIWSKSLTLYDQQYRIRTTMVQAAIPTQPMIRGLPIHGIQLDIQGQDSLRLQFYSEKTRNEAVQKIQDVIKHASNNILKRSSSTPPDSPRRGSPRQNSPSPSRRSSAILAPISRTLENRIKKSVHISADVIMQLPKAVNVPRDTLLPMRPMHFVCLTIGSRGDVQPYISLGLGLKAEGHTVTIVTHPEYKDWIEGFGIGHRVVGGDPGMLMKLSVENKMFSPQFFKESIMNFRSWLDQLLIDSWEQCQDAEVLLESPYAFAGVHIAEGLNIPYFRVCTMPWSKTTQFPHPFISPPVETPRFNSISYVLFDNVLWAATSNQINRWRREHLGIGPTEMTHLVQSKIPIIYNFSQSVVPKPLDWNDTSYPTGYWFLDNPDMDWIPPASLLKWMKQARQDHKPVVYIGFGSITVPNPNSVTEKIVLAVLKSGVRAIISKGWSSRMSKTVEPEMEIPPECYMIDKIPHE
ncbi:hypothetical protein C8Q75DRAFT_142849 [Abortiporus biennis]|nr:hypothetical protein C8Q75DRAFT_142849 [Abortiporus biennis]